MSGPSKSTVIPRVEGYNILEKVGSGSYSTVYKAVSKTGSKETVAIKCVEQGKLKGSAADNIITEIILLKKLKHPYIVEMRDFFWDSKFIYIVLEYCELGDLSYFIKKRKKLSESTCKAFLQQLAQAMKYLRDNNVCHMDLKPQNLLLTAKPQLTLKLGDFGFSQYLKTEEKLSTLRGSLLYMAPEMILLQNYGPSVDLWSIGVIMYECLFGKAPYSSSSVLEVTDKIKMQKPIEIPQNSGISSECRDLLIRLLQHDPKLRISFDDFFSHSFLDLEHIPGPDSYKKGLKIVCDAVKNDKEKKYTDAFNLYCEALRYFVPLILAENDIRKRSALRCKVNEYISRAESLKAFVYPHQHSANETNKSIVQNMSHITSGSVFRELNLLCAEDAALCEVLEIGCNAEQHYAEGQYRLAFDKFQNCIRLVLPLLSNEPPGRRRELLSNQILATEDAAHSFGSENTRLCKMGLARAAADPCSNQRKVKHWMQVAESTKALLSALDLNDANSVIEKGDSCRLQ